MRAGDVAGDGEAEAGAALVLVAGLVESHERLEHVLALLRWDARPVVVDGDEEPAGLVVAPRRAMRVAVAGGIGDEIEEQAPEGVRAHRHHRIADDLERGRVALALGIESAAPRAAPGGRSSRPARRRRRAQRRDSPRACVLISSMSRFRSSISGVCVEQRQRQLEARQDGAQIVADAVQHRGALLDGALDAPLHLDEGVAGLAHLAGAARPELDLAALAEALRPPRRGAGSDGSGCAGTGWRRRAARARSRPSTAGRCASSTRRPGCAARAPASRVWSSLTRISIEVRAPDRVDPERPRRPGGDSSSDSAWSRIEKNGFGPGGGSVASGRKSMSRLSRSSAMRASVSPFAVLRIGLVDVDQRGDVGGHGRGQAARHELPVPLHEHIGDDRLQQDDRRDDDDQRARVESLRHEPEPSQRAKRP